MHLFSVSAFFVLVTLATHGSAAGSDFAHSCQAISYVNPVVFASCRKEDGSYKQTTISLDQCVKNNNGVLSCGKK